MGDMNSRRLFLPLLIVLFLLCTAGCCHTDATRETDEKTVLLNELRECWRGLEQKRLSAVQQAQLTERYNTALQQMLQLYHEARVAHGASADADFPFIVRYEQKHSLDDALQVYDDFLISSKVDCEHLEEHNTVRGLGVPLVGIIPAESLAQANRPFAVRSHGTVSNITAVMDFPRGGRPHLHLLLRPRHETYAGHPLAGDFSAPIEIYGQLTGLKKGRFLGLLRPEELTERDLTGLSCMESYDPNKIPVVLTHGLMSSAATFDNLLNRLMNDPDIRRRYQFWFYNYPTGVAWTQTAEHFRESLAEARRKLDPKHRNRHWDEMVLIGHSMGGLITHYSQCTQPWLLLQNGGSLRQERLAPFMNARYVDKSFEDDSLEHFRKQYFFRPVQAGLVIYLATPHRGAPLARYRITRLLNHLIELPQGLASEALNILTLSDDLFIFEPSRLTDWFTSVSQLSPTSYSIRGLQGLAVRKVPTHSVIGDGGDGDPKEESSDGVVPYWSSHLPWGQETIVPASHSVQDALETAEYLKNVLREYAA